MELARLSALQKRIIFWGDFIKRDDIYPEVRKRVEKSLEELKRIVARFWDRETIGHEDEKKVLELEKELAQLNEDARTRGKGDAIWM